MDERQLPLHRRMEDAQSASHQPDIQRTPIGVERMQPVAAKPCAGYIDVSRAIRVYCITPHPKLANHQRQDACPENRAKLTSSAFLPNCRRRAYLIRDGHPIAL